MGTANTSLRRLILNIKLWDGAMSDHVGVLES